MRKRSGRGHRRTRTDSDDHGPIAAGNPPAALLFGERARFHGGPRNDRGVGHQKDKRRRAPASPALFWEGGVRELSPS